MEMIKETIGNMKRIIKDSSPEIEIAKRYGKIIIVNLKIHNKPAIRFIAPEYKINYMYQLPYRLCCGTDSSIEVAIKEAFERVADFRPFKEIYEEVKIYGEQEKIYLKNLNNLGKF